MKSILVGMVLFVASMLPSYADEQADIVLSARLQAASVTIKADSSQGSGIVFTREITVSPVSSVTVNFIWTAAHVVDGLRETRVVIDATTGGSRTVVEFRRPLIVQEIIENGQRVGEMKMDAEVIRYSDADNGEDLALLRVIKTNFFPASVEFYLGNDIPPVGSYVSHVGSLYGQMGANSFTAGRISQIGRIIDGKVFDQTTATAFPGSSGGGIFFEGGPYAGQCLGILTRGAGETFSMFIGSRRILSWAKKAGVLWALDRSVEAPNLVELDDIIVEDNGSVPRARISFREWAEAKEFLIGFDG